MLRAAIFLPSQNSGATIAKGRAEQHEQQRRGERAAGDQQSEQEAADAEGDQGEQLDADPVGPTQPAGISGLLELGVDRTDHPAFMAPAQPGQPLDSRAQHTLVEGQLQLHLFQRLGLDDELGESLLDRVLGRSGRDAVRDEQDGKCRQDGDDEDQVRFHGSRP